MSSIGNNGYISQQVLILGHGTLYGSYQHATKKTSYKIANSYNFNHTGYGGVFGFYGNALSVYDGMFGVKISF